MQITIEAAKTRNGKIKEWGLLEFQGTFVTRDDQQIHKQFIGDLNFNKDGTPFFIVGHHILFGEEVKLNQPFAVLKKDALDGADKTRYSVEAIVRRKILFKSRPKPIICEQVNINNS